MADALALWATLTRAQLRSEMQYRMSFGLRATGSIINAASELVVIAVLFHQVPALGGWSLTEVAFLYGAAGLAFHSSDVLFGHLKDFSASIRTGTFDVILIRPRHSLLQVVASEFAWRHLGRPLQAAVILAFAITNLDIHWTASRIAGVPIMILSGLVIFAAIWVTTAAAAFFLINGTEATNAFTYGGALLATYPIDVYTSWLRRIVVFVIPLAFVAWYPALHILDKPDPLGLPHAMRHLSPLVAAIAAGIALGTWQSAVRRYRSTGS